MLRSSRFRILILSGFLAVAFFSCKNRGSQANVSAQVGGGGAAVPNVLAAGDRSADWSNDRYLGKVQPLLAARCAVCHGCTSSPCNLKLDSYEGFLRGASAMNHYGVHVGANPVPLEAVGAPNFFKVAEADGVETSAHLAQSILFKLVQHGSANNQVSVERGFDRSRSEPLRKQYESTANFQCPATVEATAQFLATNPSAGMPFGLPGLPEPELDVIRGWISAGAPGPSAAAEAKLQAPSNKSVIHRWETFLNQPTPKGRLVARYIYEHSFEAAYNFDAMPNEFFRLVRSVHAPNAEDLEEPDEILTEVPTDSPNEGRRASRVAQNPNERCTSPVFFYRFKKIKGVITRKNHVPWQVNDRTLARLDELFMQPAWDTEYQPNYTQKNPFEVFSDIPQVSRHKFMNEQSRLIVNSMVRAPVCVGDRATYAIADHFWVWFLNPESEVAVDETMRPSLALDLTSWTAAGEAQERYTNNQTFNEAYEAAVRAKLESERAAGKRPSPGYGLDDLWFGSGAVEPRSAWLTVMRHQQSATVHYGQEGGFPQSIWVLNYPNFERLYYNLVVHFKYWDSTRHKLSTWQSMSHERLNGEDTFLGFLPDGRLQLRELYAGGIQLPFYARGIAGVFLGKEVKRYIDLYPLVNFTRPGATALPGTDRADVQFAKLVRARMPEPVQRSGSEDLLNSVGAPNRLENIALDEVAAQAPAFNANPQNFAEFEESFRLLAQGRGKGKYAPFIPDTTYLRVRFGTETRLYSLLRNRGYLSHNLAFGEKSVEAPERDNISIIRGSYGDFPQLFLDVEGARAGALLQKWAELRLTNEEGAVNAVTSQILTNFGIARNSPNFWPFVDWLHANAGRLSGHGDGYTEEGVVDLSRYEMF